METYHGVIYLVAGKYPKSVMDKIIELSGNQDSVDWDDTLSIEDAYAKDGSFEELEDYLVKVGIPFDRDSSAFFEIQPESRIFRPGKLDTTIRKDHDGYEYVKSHELVAILEQENYSDSAKLLSIQELLNEQVPSYTHLADYEILWSDDSNKLFIPTEDYEPNGEVTISFNVKQKKTENEIQLERLVNEISSL